MDRDQIVRTIQKNIRQIGGDLCMDFPIDRLSLFLIESLASLDQETNHDGVGIADEIILAFFLLGGMPHCVIVWIAAQLPPQNDRFKIFGIDKLMDEGRPFDNTDIHIDADLMQLLLDHLRGKLSEFVALIGHECK
jgi:hypothetical protein